MRNRKYIVDLNSKTYQVAKYKQYDNNIDYSIELIEDGISVDLSNCIVKAFFETPNKLILQKDCLINKNIITTTLDNNILGKVGKVSVEFTIYKNNSIITTFTLNLEVEKSINKNDAIQKEPVWDIIANLLEIDETVRIKLEEVDNKIIETTEITNTNTSKIDNKILDIQNQLDSRISEKFTEIDNTLESKTTEKFIAVDEILNEKQTQIQEQVDNKISDADNKILDCEERMQNIESNFGDLVDGTGYATTEFVNKSLEKKSNIDHRHNVSEIDDLNMNAEDISLSDGSNVEQNIYSNKENIQYIKNELSKTENTKYTTKNGIKEFECKNNGYIDNVVIEGKTLVNLCRKSEDIVVNSEKSILELFGNENHKRISNGEFTLINTSDKAITFDIRNIEDNRYLRKFVLTNERLVVSLSDTEYIRNLYGKFSDVWTSNDSDEFEKSIIILEGEYIDKPISYFEGLKSVGQGDKIEILTRNSNENKQDKKQISTTLRSLLNGVTDTIEKRGNKYVKIQRCGEVVLTGDSIEGKYNSGETVNTLRVYTPLAVGMNVKTNSAECNHFISDKFKSELNLSQETTDVESLSIRVGGEGRFVFRMLKSKLPTQDLDGAKTWLNSNPVTVVYELKNPIATELPNFNPQTFEGNTTLLINSGVIQAECDFEVTNSMGSEIDIMRNKINDVYDYIDRELVSEANRLKNILISKNVECEDNDKMPSLIDKVNLLENPDNNKLYLYKEGDECTDITGGWIDGYVYGNGTSLTKGSDYIETRLTVASNTRR